MEVFRAPITTKLDSGPRPSAGRAMRGRPVAIVPRKAQTNAIRLGLAARLPRSCRRVFHMLRAKAEAEGVGPEPFPMKVTLLRVSGFGCLGRLIIRIMRARLLAHLEVAASSKSSGFEPERGQDVEEVIRQTE